MFTGDAQEYAYTFKDDHKTDEEYRRWDYYALNDMEEMMAPYEIQVKTYDNIITHEFLARNEKLDVEEDIDVGDFPGGDKWSVQLTSFSSSGITQPDDDWALIYTDSDEKMYVERTTFQDSKLPSDGELSTPTDVKPVFVNAEGFTDGTNASKQDATEFTSTSTSLNLIREGNLVRDKRAYAVLTTNLSKDYIPPFEPYDLFSTLDEYDYKPEIPDDAQFAIVFKAGAVALTRGHSWSFEAELDSDSPSFKPNYVKRLDSDEIHGGTRLTDEKWNLNNTRMEFHGKDSHNSQGAWVRYFEFGEYTDTWDSFVRRQQIEDMGQRTHEKVEPVNNISDLTYYADLVEEKTDFDTIWNAEPVYQQDLPESEYNSTGIVQTENPTEKFLFRSTEEVIRPQYALEVPAEKFDFAVHYDGQGTPVIKDDGTDDSLEITSGNSEFMNVKVYNEGPSWDVMTVEPVVDSFDFSSGELANLDSTMTVPPEDSRTFDLAIAPTGFEEEETAQGKIRVSAQGSKETDETDVSLTVKPREGSQPPTEKGHATITVIDKNGNPVNDASVSLQRGEREWSEATTGSGTAEFRNLPASSDGKTYTVIAEDVPTKAERISPDPMTESLSFRPEGDELMRTSTSINVKANETAVATVVLNEASRNWLLIGGIIVTVLVVIGGVLYWKRDELTNK